MFDGASRLRRPRPPDSRALRIWAAASVRSVRVSAATNHLRLEEGGHCLRERIRRRGTSHGQIDYRIRKSLPAQRGGCCHPTIRRAKASTTGRRRQSLATSGRIKAGEPHFRELEPHQRLTGSTRLPASWCVAPSGRLRWRMAGAATSQLGCLKRQIVGEPSRVKRGFHALRVKAIGPHTRLSATNRAPAALTRQAASHVEGRASSTFASSIQRSCVCGAACKLGLTSGRSRTSGERTFS